MRTETVYSKALALFVALCVLLGAAVLSLTQFVIGREFRLTEEREIERSVNALRALLDRELSYLDALLARSARTTGRSDAAHIEAGRIDLVGRLDPGGGILEAWSPAGIESPAAHPALKPVAEAVHTAMQRGGQRSGYDAPEGSLALLAWRPAADGSADFVVRFWDSEDRAFAETVLDAGLSFQPIRNITIGTPGSESLNEMLSGDRISVAQAADGRMVGSTILRGLDGSVLGTFDLARDPKLLRSGEGAVQIFLTVLVLAGGLLFGLTWFLLDRTILQRVRDLTRQVEEEKDRGRLPVRLAFRGSDELGTLARRIEELAGLIEKLQFQYRAVVEDQTETICRFDENFEVSFCNEAFRKCFGAPADAARPALREVLPAEAFAHLTRRYQRLYPGDPIAEFHHSLAIEGREVCLRSTLRRTFDAAGNGDGGQWVAADVTKQVLAERGVAESESRLRALSARLLRTQDDERRKIARELHDSTAQSLAALEMNVSLLEPSAPDERMKRLVADTRRIAQDCCQQLRNISYLLHPPLLDEVGLVFALRWFCDGFTDRTGIEVSLEVGEEFPRLDKDVETALFRIVQEATSNIYRHSGARKAWIHLGAQAGDQIALVITDDGHGFVEAAGAGIGLASMRERLSPFGGKLSIANSPKGVTLTAELPITTPHG